MFASPHRVLLYVLAACLTSGCGARTTLSTGEDAATPDAGRDAGALDGGSPEDAAPPDAGPPDAGPACENDDPCVGPEVCRGVEVFTPDDLSPLPLTCGRPTPGASPIGAVCRNRTECDRGLCALAGACVAPCGGPGDCGTGELCRQVYVLTSRTTMQTVQACVAEVAAAIGVEVTVDTSVAVMPDALVFDPVALESNTLVVYEGDPDAIPALVEVRNSMGVTVFDAAGIGGSRPDWGLNPVALNSFVTVLYPNGPRSPEPGIYELGLSALLSPTATRRTVAQRSGEGERLDLDLYLVGGNRWTSPDGELPSGLPLAIESARTIFASVGVRLGEIRVHEVVGGLRTRLSILRGGVPPFDAPAGLSELYQLSAGARLPGVHVFFVREIDGALGIASGIPGVQVLPGTGASGVAISADLVPNDELGAVMVHEIGHYLGLFHSTESDGNISDPYDDTPACSSAQDTNGDGFVDPFECAGLGAENVMFWAGSGSGLSPQQGVVLRGSPLMGR